MFYRHKLARIFGVTPYAIELWADLDRLVPTRDDLGRRCWTVRAIRDFVSGYRDRTGEPRMDRLRLAIFVTYKAAPAAFEQGCGRDTMGDLLCLNTGDDYPAGEVRRSLLGLVQEGLFEHGVTYNGYSTFRWAEDT